MSALASRSFSSPPTSFKLVEVAPGRAVFANPEHDFPQRITYSREGDALHARVEGVEDGKPRVLELDWRRQDPCDDRRTGSGD